MTHATYQDPGKHSLPPPLQELERLLVVHGMMRSGNHAIIAWIRGQQPMPFFNALNGPGVPYGRTQRKPSKLNFAEWRMRNPALRRLGSEPSKYLIVSLEDHPPDFIPFTDVLCEVQNILILRDPYNALASKIKLVTNEKGHYDLLDDMLPTLVNLWMDYAREFVGDSQQLDNKVCINYNQWFASENYRKSISAALGFTFNDNNFTFIPNHGGGSSFDSRRYQRQSYRMQLNRRFDQLNKDERAFFDKYVCREDVAEMASRLWPDMPPPRRASGWSLPEIRRL